MAHAPRWRLDLQDTTGAVTQTLEIPYLSASLPPPPPPSKSEAERCIVTALLWSYDPKMANKIRVEQSGYLPDYQFIATHIYPSSGSSEREGSIHSASS
jgi:hypothetical protein